MQYSGTLSKMHTHAGPSDTHASSASNTVHYSLPIGEHKVDMNALIGQSIAFSFEQQINCTHCGRATKKSFNQGYCYPCMMRLAQCDTCIIKPELCHYHQGTCREPEWGEANCLQDHFVYLANTGTLKVGITRHITEGVSSRWMDQGATQAIVVMRVPDRLTSGLVETAFKSHVADKTNWRTMLKGAPEAIDLQTERQRLLSLVEDDLQAIAAEKGLHAFAPVDAPALSINYPVEHYPNKIKSINLEKTPDFNGILQGIKGQYWLLDEDRVINIRKYTGYHCTLTVDD